ncbi:MAG: dephospho-CoA kinase [Sulfuricella sp.]|nr:dephospho-CoA kinase [Sulfuricella sp.]
MLAIGLTGGIGCGKSSVARIFAELGAGVIDTDEIAHRLTHKDAPGLAAIAAQFGAEYFLPDGNLDRAKLRRLVFSDPGAKEKLEAILHPLIRRQVTFDMAAIRAPYLVLVVPLFFETGAYHDLVDRVLVVDCGEDQQVSRTMARSGLTAAEVRTIMANQISRADRVRLASDILPNHAGHEELVETVRKLHRRYLELAADDEVRKR